MPAKGKVRHRKVVSSLHRAHLEEYSMSDSPYHARFHSSTTQICTRGCFAQDFDFHDHRSAVNMNQHPLWYLMSVAIKHLSPTLDSSLIASSAYLNGPLKFSFIPEVESSNHCGSYPFKV